MTDPGAPAPGPSAPAGHVHPTQEDPLVAALSDGVGGPVGTRARAVTRGWWTPTRVLLALCAAVFALGMVQKGPCAETTWLGDQVMDQMCYSDLPYLYTERGLAELAWPWSDDPGTRARFETLEYPVGIGYLAYATAWGVQVLAGPLGVTGDGDAAREGRSGLPLAELAATDDVRQETLLFVAMTAVLLALAALASTWLLARTDPRRPWDAAFFALSPLLALTALINFDLYAVVFMAAALWAWARDRPVLTGVLIGIGTAVKLFPIVLLGAVLLVCLRGRRIVDGLVVAVWTIAAWLALNLPAYLSSAAEWGHFFRFNSDRGPDLGSVWLVVDQAFGLQISAHTVNVGTMILLGVWTLAVSALVLRAPTRATLAQAGLLLLMGLLLTNKVYSPQYAVLLLPLAALAVPRLRDQLIWQAGEVLYFGFVWFYLGGDLEPARGGDAGFYWLAVVVRVLAELWLVACVVRALLRRDPAPPGPRPLPDPPAAERDFARAWSPR